MENGFNYRVGHRFRQACKVNDLCHVNSLPHPSSSLSSRSKERDPICAADRDTLTQMAGDTSVQARLNERYELFRNSARMPDRGLRFLASGLGPSNGS